MPETPIQQLHPVFRLARTLFVLLLLAVAAVAYSYLGAFALTSMLLSADLINHWPLDADPRPRWMLMSLAGMVGTFLLLALFFKWTGWRQMRYLD